MSLIILPLDNPHYSELLNNHVNMNSNNFINLVLLNEQIIIKFNSKAQIELWDGVYEILKKDPIKVKKTLNTPKICLLVKNYDEKRYEKYCCYIHASLFINGNINENRNNIMTPEMNIKVGKLFEIIQIYIDMDNEGIQVEDIF